MAPRSRLLDLERHDVLIFYDDGVSVATYGIVFWPVFLVAALLLHLVAPFPHAAAVCAALYVAYCFLLDRAGEHLHLLVGFHRRRRRAAGRDLSPHYSGSGQGGSYMIEQKLQ